MSLFAVADLMVRGGIIALVALWSWLLLRDHRQSAAARIGVAMNVSTTGHVLASIPNMDSGFVVIDAGVDTLSTATIGLFWLFARSWFSDSRRLDWKAWLAALLPPLVVATMYLGGAMFGPFDRFIWFPLLRLIWLAMIVDALRIAWQGRDDDLIEARRRIRLAFIVVVSILAVVVLTVEVGVFRFGLDERGRSLPELAILLCSFALIAAMLTHRQYDLFGAAARERPAAQTPDDPLAGRLRAIMETERPYRDERMTIAALAAQLGEQEYRLRRTINRAMGHRNFAQFLNSWRLAEVKTALADPAQREVPILTIALDAGFGSLGPFNRAFREAEGMTPSEYRIRALADSGIG